MNNLLFEIDNTLTLAHALIILGSSLAISVLISCAYIFTHRVSGFRRSMVFTLMLLSPISGIIILIVGNSVARALSVGGGIALIRYRSTFDDPGDLAYVFMSLALGMACGLGFIGFAAVAAVILLAVILILHLTKAAGGRHVLMKLKILIPENLDYYGAFDDILAKYCISPKLEKTRLTDYGTLYELNYRLAMRNPAEQKAMLDEIRCRNGNLTVTLSVYADEVQ